MNTLQIIALILFALSIIVILTMSITTTLLTEGESSFVALSITYIVAYIFYITMYFMNKYDVGILTPLW